MKSHGRSSTSSEVVSTTEATWRTFLRNAICAPHEAQRLAQELGVTQITIKRWAANQSNPRFQHLQKLMLLFPQQHDFFLSSIHNEFPDFFPLSQPDAEEAAEPISVDFYHLILTQLLATRSPFHYWSIRESVLQYILNQVDAHHQDTMVMLALCTPPAQGTIVRSLRGVMCVGNPSPGYSLEMKPFLGAESLVGYAAMILRPVIVADVQQNTTLPIPRRSEHQSIVVYPLLHQGDHIAGTLTIASCRPNAFSMAHIRLMEQCATLFSFTCSSEEFFPPQSMLLQIMPSLAVQAPYLAQFVQRVRHVRSHTTDVYTSMSYEQAERIVWHQLEEELCQQALNEIAGSKEQSLQVG